uniref:Reverse transcriptase domain-containing protein n=1 Tax=Cannabis sativa TaxID=3483 RepID=A0A803Q373_CANSA
MAMVIGVIPQIVFRKPFLNTIWGCWDNWQLVGSEVEEAVLSFLNSGKILKEIKATTITLIPKFELSKECSLISDNLCCNVYTKVPLSMPGLVRLYGRKNCKPSCMIEIDLRKAYDTVKWDFIEEMLAAFGFPSMEYLSRILKKIGEWPGFKFHDRCSSLKLNHLCFAEYLLILSNGDSVSTMLMLKGLLPNEQKTAIYCSGMANVEVNRILDASNFKRSTLPFRYLGIPICSKKISKTECKELLEKMEMLARSQDMAAIENQSRILTLLADKHKKYQGYFSNSKEYAESSVG